MHTHTRARTHTQVLRERVHYRTLYARPHGLFGARSPATREVVSREVEAVPFGVTDAESERAGETLELTLGGSRCESACGGARAHARERTCSHARARTRALVHAHARAHTGTHIRGCLR